MKKLIKLLCLLILLPTPSITAQEFIKADDKDIKIGIVYYKFDDVYITSVRVTFERLVAEYDNVELLSYNSQNQQDLQLQQIDQLIAENVDVLLVNIVDTDSAHLAVEKAALAELPIILFNRESEQELYSDYDMARYVGTAATEAGVIQGNMIADLWLSDIRYDRNNNGVLDYVMLIGDTNNLEAKSRTEYSVTTVENAGIDVNLIGSEVATWNYDNAYEAMTNWLATEVDNIDIVFANNDSMAAGAIAALQEIGFNLGRDHQGISIPVFGVDATEEALDLISRGIMAGSVMQDEGAMADAIFALAYNVSQGRDFLAGTAYEFDESGIALRIPYQAFVVE